MELRVDMEERKTSAGRAVDELERAYDAEVKSFLAEKSVLLFC